MLYRVWQEVSNQIEYAAIQRVHLIANCVCQRDKAIQFHTKPTTFTQLHSSKDEMRMLCSKLKYIHGIGLGECKKNEFLKLPSLIHFQIKVAYSYYVNSHRDAQQIEWKKITSKIEYEHVDSDKTIELLKL